jgi:hypothetical protein
MLITLSIAPMLWPSLSKDDGCALETAFQADVESAPAKPSVQEARVKGVSATSAIHDINLMRFAEETLTPEIGFRTYITQCDCHS